MTELDLLRTFFNSWESLHALGPGDKNSLEHKMAAQLLVDAAQAVRVFRQPEPSAEVNDLRSMQQQVADIPPKNGFIKPH